jgi:hypothetical protein
MDVWRFDWGRKPDDRERVLRASSGDPFWGLAMATKDPRISAALFEKAADLKLQVDEPGAPNLTPLAPDIEPPAM